MEFLIEEASQIIIVIAVLCTLITIITEFTKDIGFLKRIPTSLQVLVLSIVVCVVSFFAYISYAGIVYHWYFLVAVFFESFVVAIICCKGWDYLFEIWSRFFRKTK